MSGLDEFIKTVTQWGFALVEGSLITLQIFFLALVSIHAVGTIVALCRLSPFWLLRLVAIVYVEFFRGVSLFVTMFWFFFALPFLGITLDPIEAGVVALTLVHGAYVSEYIRGAIIMIPKGQYEAAVALNMTPYHRMRYVIFPQALVAMMPLFGNEVILLLKGTSIASLITIHELTAAGRNIVAQTLQPFPVFGAVLILYFLMGKTFVAIVRWIERVVGHWRDPSAPHPTKLPLPGE